MTSFLRFFILALTSLLGVSGSLGPAFLFGLVATVLMVGVSTLRFAARDSLHETGLVWASVGGAVVLVTLVDWATSGWLPGVRAAWGVYLNLLAFSPLIILLPRERRQAEDLGSELLPSLKAGLWLTLLLVGTALVREAFGRGTLTLVPGKLAWDIPGLKAFPLAILATGAGGFFLAAAGVVAYRSLKPQWADDSPSLEPLERSAPPLAPVPAPVPPETPAARTTPTERSEEWGETLAGAVADLSSGTIKEKRRLLVIGSGNGEVAWYLAMLCLDQSRSTEFGFRVRGVDHFATRVDAAVRGVYRDHQIEFIPAATRDAWMVRNVGEDKHLWRVGAEPRLHVQFAVADFHQGAMFFSQPAHLIVLNQGIEFVVDEKKVHLLKTVCDHLLPGGALVVEGPFKRELLPEGMKRTGTTVFRKA